MRRRSRLTIISFGFRFGHPGANYYFDVGFLRNPAREEGWSLFSDLSGEMQHFVLQQEECKRFLETIIPLVQLFADLDHDARVAFGCSSGRHRSVIIAEEVARRIRELGVSVDVVHREARHEKGVLHEEGKR